MRVATFATITALIGACLASVVVTASNDDTNSSSTTSSPVTYGPQPHRGSPRTALWYSIVGALAIRCALCICGAALMIRKFRSGEDVSRGKMAMDIAPLMVDSPRRPSQGTFTNDSIAVAEEQKKESSANQVN